MHGCPRITFRKAKRTDAWVDIHVRLCVAPRKINAAERMQAVEPARLAASSYLQRLSYGAVTRSKIGCGSP